MGRWIHLTWCLPTHLQSTQGQVGQVHPQQVADVVTGRYGDALNPWGDILSVAEAWCVSSDSAMLALGVPSIVHLGRDITVFNAHKMYGPVMYPFIATNWKFVWPHSGGSIVNKQVLGAPGQVLQSKGTENTNVISFKVGIFKTQDNNVMLGKN